MPRRTGTDELRRRIRAVAQTLWRSRTARHRRARTLGPVRIRSRPGRALAPTQARRRTDRLGGGTPRGAVHRDPISRRSLARSPRAPASSRVAAPPAHDDEPVARRPVAHGRPRRRRSMRVCGARSVPAAPSGTGHAAGRPTEHKGRRRAHPARAPARRGGGAPAPLPVPAGAPHPSPTALADDNDMPRPPRPDDALVAPPPRARHAPCGLSADAERRPSPGPGRVVSLAPAAAALPGRRRLPRPRGALGPAPQLELERAVTSRRPWRTASRVFPAAATGAPPRHRRRPLPGCRPRGRVAPRSGAAVIPPPPPALADSGRDARGRPRPPARRSDHPRRRRSPAAAP